MRGGELKARGLFYMALSVPSDYMRRQRAAVGPEAATVSLHPTCEQITDTSVSAISSKHGHVVQPFVFSATRNASNLAVVKRYLHLQAHDDTVSYPTSWHTIGSTSGKPLSSCAGPNRPSIQARGARL